MHLGKYELVRRINAGGMAELFLARAAAMQGFEKIVVVKRILPQFIDNTDFVQMFLAEARLAATLHHPNIAQVYDIGEQDGEYFFVMEWIQGQDVRALVRAAQKAQMPLPRELMVHIGLGLAAGLHHAHEQRNSQGEPLGIVHRDVSPANILVSYEGDVKVVDFGIAKATSRGAGTVAGALKGKIPYMSPEQCRGELVDRRSDVFSIGTMLWELTLGRRLFKGENEFGQLAAVQRGEIPRPTSIDPNYPPALEAVVLRALERDKHRRYQTAKDLQLALEEFVRAERLAVSANRMAEFMDRLFPSEERAEPITLSGRETLPDTISSRALNSRSLVPGRSTTQRWLVIAGLLTTGAVVAAAATIAVMRRNTTEELRSPVETAPAGIGLPAPVVITKPIAVPIPTTANIPASEPAADLVVDEDDETRTDIDGVHDETRTDIDDAHDDVDNTSTPGHDHKVVKPPSRRRRSKARPNKQRETPSKPAPAHEESVTPPPAPSPPPTESTTSHRRSSDIFLPAGSDKRKDGLL